MVGEYSEHAALVIVAEVKETVPSQDAAEAPIQRQLPHVGHDPLVIGQTVATKRYHRPRRVNARHAQASLGHMLCNRPSRTAAQVQNPCSRRQAVDEEVVPDFIVPPTVLAVGIPHRGVFLPQIMPQDFVSNTATPLLLRPHEFLANARDLVTLKAAVAEQAPRYANIGAPMVVITGDVDKTVSTNIHSRPLTAVVPNAKLIVLPDVGHMVQNAAPDLVISEIEAMIGTIARSAAAQSATPRF